ncbi:response regulator [Flavobacterium sp. FZUC8N2.13]|uniref:Response regulator n=1 Tax=Flavobacterium zubiriense TaxID=3138075 RepID=A0ABV4TDF4_9FLAO
MEESLTIYKFLIVEDNPGDFFLIEEYLTESFSLFSLKIENAKDFAEAKSFLSDPLQCFNMIFLDLTLPDKQGEELIKNILQEAKEIPVIILTGYSEIEFSIRSLQLGVADYLSKDELNTTLLYKSVLYNIERKRKKMELEESKKLYSDLFHLSPIPMWVYDMETLCFLDINQAAVSHYGYTSDEFLSMTIRDIKPTQEMEKMNLVLKNKGTLFKDKFKHIKKDGTLIDVEIESSCIDFLGRKAKLVLANDITEKNNYLETIENQNQNLKEIARIQSHVVRAPVARILGLLNYIEEYDLNDDEKKFFQESIKVSILELDEIIKDITNRTNL